MKRDDINLQFQNFSHLDINIPNTPIYRVYISNLTPLLILSFKTFFTKHQHLFKKYCHFQTVSIFALDFGSK